MKDPNTDTTRGKNENKTKKNCTSILSLLTFHNFEYLNKNILNTIDSHFLMHNLARFPT